MDKANADAKPKPKSRRQQKQDEREIKNFDDVVSGRVIIELHEKNKKPAQANRKGGGAGAEEQGELAAQYVRVLKFLLPGIMAMLSTIEDPRNPKRITHSLSAIVLYGILLFLSNMPSRRAANREIGGSKLVELMDEFVPGYASMPHADTLERLLRNVAVDELEGQYNDILARFIKSDNLKALNKGRFQVLIDGTMKFSRNRRWDEKALSRNADDPGNDSYFAYVLESALVLDNGLLLPLLTETLENGESFEGNGKQDCETKAFKRLAVRIKKLLGAGCVTIIADGLYATGPMVSLCDSFGWGYMITLKKDCLKSVWEDFEGLRKIETSNSLYAKWGERGQEYCWSNRIEYIYGGNHKKLFLNVLSCTEVWLEKHPRKGGRPEEKRAEYAWLSSSKITSKNAFELCMLGRRRWRIENHFHVLKYDGYSLMHCFSENWNAMKGYHYLMKIACFINSLILHNETMQECVKAEGKKGVIKKVWNYLFLKKLSEFMEVAEQLSKHDSPKRNIIRFQKLRLIA